MFLPRAYLGRKGLRGGAPLSHPARVHRLLIRGRVLPGITRWHCPATAGVTQTLLFVLRCRACSEYRCVQNRCVSWWYAPGSQP
eukprot:9890152-Lingulodinium_polyedra.AAC.1